MAALKTPVASPVGREDTLGVRSQCEAVVRADDLPQPLRRRVAIGSAPTVGCFRRYHPQPLALRREWGFAPLCGAAATSVAALKTPVASEGGEGLPGRETFLKSE